MTDRAENAKYWTERWNTADIQWDHGEPAPPMVEFLEINAPQPGEMLIPGCGSGHEVHLFARHGFKVLGMDIASKAVEHAREQNSHVQASYVQGDFLNLSEEFHGRFDWLAEHTCLCALNPSFRLQYRNSVHQALRSGGLYLAIFYINPLSPDGPPFRISPQEIDDLFSPAFDLLHRAIPVRAFDSRLNREEIRLYRKLP